MKYDSPGNSQPPPEKPFSYVKDYNGEDMKTFQADIPRHVLNNHLVYNTSHQTNYWDIPLNILRNE